MQKKDQIINLLDNLIDLLKEEDQENWVLFFSKIKYDLNQNKNLNTSTSDILNVYAGMGSFNDVYLTKNLNNNIDFLNLKNQLWKLTTSLKIELRKN